MRKLEVCLYCHGDERCAYCRGTGILPEISSRDYEKLVPRDPVAEMLNETFGIRVVSLSLARPSAEKIEDFHYRQWDQQRFRSLMKAREQKIITTVDEIKLERQEGLALWRAAKETGSDEIN